ncbi:MAG: hypothetical protein GEU91_14070 [Rhizobiales bacterium]|nr:hypothetical protein [Hyphomicrobiales bacterium]
MFRTKGQMAFIEAFCRLAWQAIDEGKAGEYIIDMDTVADQVAGSVERPAFYYTEESQQTKFACSACGGRSDILGISGYCSTCGTRNDLQQFEEKIAEIRDRLQSGDIAAYDVVKDAVSAFDSCARAYMKQLASKVPMTSKRRQRFERMLFNDVCGCATEVRSAFEIDMLDGLTEGEIAFATKMFHRRHIYVHNNGEVDERYLRESGDTGIKLKQVLRETSENAVRITTLLVKMARNLQRDFHAIFPPEKVPIEMHNPRKTPRPRGATRP